ncbi:MAG: hypothetical protein JW850_02845 [Thermoflexales bacterium]|nr:hypothetical protein [Thermoflexales bacterium]
MPAITIQSLELTDEQKEILADKYITIFSEVTRVPKDRIYLFFDGYSLDNAATDGILFSKRPPKLAIGKFSQPKREE